MITCFCISCSTSILLVIFRFTEEKCDFIFLYSSSCQCLFRTKFNNYPNVIPPLKGCYNVLKQVLSEIMNGYHALRIKFSLR